jgi:hypothetical protein
MLGFSMPEAARRQAGQSGPVVLDLTGPVLPAGVRLERGSPAACFDAAGLIQQHPAGSARFDHDPVSHAAIGLAVEPGAVNLADHAAASAASWSALGTGLSQLSLGALGMFPGLRVASGGSSWHRAETTGGGWAANTAHRVSVFYQTGTSGHASVVIRNVTAGADSSLNGPAGALAANSSSAGSVTDIRNAALGGGIYLVEATFTPAAAAAQCKVGVGPFSALAGEDLVVLGVQLEEGSAATSFINSDGSPAVRAPDTVLLDSWNGTRTVTIVYSDGTSETRAGSLLSAGHVLTPLARRRVTSITLE